MPAWQPMAFYAAVFSGVQLMQIPSLLNYGLVTLIGSTCMHALTQSAALRETVTKPLSLLFWLSSFAMAALSILQVPLALAIQVPLSLVYLIMFIVTHASAYSTRGTLLLSSVIIITSSFLPNMSLSIGIQAATLGLLAARRGFVGVCAVCAGMLVALTYAHPHKSSSLWLPLNLMALTGLSNPLGANTGTRRRLLLAVQMSATLFPIVLRAADATITHI